MFGVYYGPNTPWYERRWGQILFALMLIAGVCSLVYLITVIDDRVNHVTENRRIAYQHDRETLYKAWCKVYPAVKLTFQEWDTLEQHDMLPGQKAGGTGDSGLGIAGAVAAGMAGGMMVSD